MEEEFNNLNVEFSIILNTVAGEHKNRQLFLRLYVCGDLIQLNGKGCSGD